MHLKFEYVEMDIHKDHASLYLYSSAQQSLFILSLANDFNVEFKLLFLTYFLKFDFLYF